MTSKPPLDGIRILSLAEQLPGPYATLLLADLGADVILVERPNGGDPSRRFDGLFASLNRNKRSVVIDLKQTLGREQFLSLVDTADVVMEGFRPGVMGRLGLDAQSLRERKPDLVYASISAFGQEGPMAAMVGHDLSIQAAAGLIKVPLGEESRSTIPTLPLADIASGLFAALSVVAALLRRERDGPGCCLDVSMLDSLVSWMTPFLVPGLNGMSVRELPPLEPAYGVFRTRDDRQLTLSVAGEDAMWRALCDLLGLQPVRDLVEKEREERTVEIDSMLRRAIAQWDHDSLQAQLIRLGIACGPVLQGSHVLEAPQIVHRQLVAREVGPQRQAFIRQPVLFDGTHFEIRHPPPGLGEHTDEVLGRANAASVSS
jgi:crotonobetainyl-CoA:carnitine CoA-transferase CaiB-like acyl-CoA transferase